MGLLAAQPRTLMRAASKCSGWIAIALMTASASASRSRADARARGCWGPNAFRPAPLSTYCSSWNANPHTSIAAASGSARKPAVYNAGMTSTLATSARRRTAASFDSAMIWSAVCSILSAPRSTRSFRRRRRTSALTLTLPVFAMMSVCRREVTGAQAAHTARRKKAAPFRPDTTAVREPPIQHLLLLGVDLRDLVPLDPEPGHEPLLAEDERVDVVLHCRGRRTLRLPLVQNDNARTDADLESARGVELLDGLGVHEEHRVAVGLRAHLESHRCARRSVIADGLAILEQRAFARLSADPEASLGDFRED